MIWFNQIHPATQLTFKQYRDLFLTRQFAPIHYVSCIATHEDFGHLETVKIDRVGLGKQIKWLKNFLALFSIKKRRPVTTPKKQQQSIP